QEAIAGAVRLALQAPQERQRAAEALRAVEHDALLGPRELFPRHVERDARAFRQLAQAPAEVAPPRARPGIDRALSQRLPVVGHDQRLVELQDVAEAFALRAHAVGRVEREQNRLGARNLAAIGRTDPARGRGREPPAARQEEPALAAPEGEPGRLLETARALARPAEAVGDHEQLLGAVGRPRQRSELDRARLAPHAQEAVGLQALDHGLPGQAAGHGDGRQHGDVLALGPLALGLARQGAGRVGHYWQAAVGTDRYADAGEEEP